MMIKKKAKSLAVILLVICSLFVMMPQTLSLNVSAASNAPLDGIDYTRLTQKASTAMSNFDVRMKIGDVELKGLFAGSEGLTMGEINEIILSQLSLMHLDLEEIAVLSSLGENLERAQWIEFGKKLAVALSEYIPSVGPGGTVSPTDLVKYVLYGTDPLAAAPGSILQGKTGKDGP